MMDNHNCPYNCSTSKGKSSIIVICVVAGLITPIVILTIYAIYLHCKGKLRTQSSTVHDIEAAATASSTSQPPTKSGLDKTTLDSYPVSAVGDQELEGQTCPICLLDYQQKEMVKTLPGCLHCFHAHCIDPWLCSYATCPICRAQPPPNHS